MPFWPSGIVSKATTFSLGPKVPAVADSLVAPEASAIPYTGVVAQAFRAVIRASSVENSVLS